MKVIGNSLPGLQKNYLLACVLIHFIKHGPIIPKLLLWISFALYPLKRQMLGLNKVQKRNKGRMCHETTLRTLTYTIACFWHIRIRLVTNYGR